MIFLSSIITSATEFFYKLGRSQNFLDLFRHFVGLIPVIFFREIGLSKFKHHGTTRFLVFCVLLLTSISFNYTYFRVPEFGFFLALPFFIHWIENQISISENIKIAILLLFTLLFFHSFISYNSLSSLVMYSILFLGSLIFLIRTRLPLGYYFIILILNLSNIITFEVQTLGEFPLLKKISFPLLNTNRVSDYYALFLVLPFFYLGFSYFQSKKSFFISLAILLCIILALLSNYSRAAFLAISFVVLFYITLLWNLTKLRVILFFFFYLFLLLPLWVYLSTKLGYGFFQSLTDWSAGRIEFWNQFLEIFQRLDLKQKILGLGIGEQNFFISFMDTKTAGIVLDFVKGTDGSFIHPHNLFLSILFYFGLAGAIFYLIGVLFFLKFFHTTSQRKAIYSLSLILFLVHNSLDSLENTLSLVIILAHFLSSSFSKKTFIYSSKSRFFPVVLGIVVLFLLFRSYHSLYNHKNFSIQSKTWKDVRSCQFAYIPDIAKIQEQYKLSLPFDWFLFPELRRSQENFLYAFNYYKKFPTKENYEIVEKTLEICNKKHFRAPLCKFYEENKIVIIFDYYDHLKELDKYPKVEIVKCFKN
ncbi:MAG: O-antigen ligase family protein [Leptospiraceae bacterium]|nr:O-antigen ligase family protein [Leptospiraceae bacterium]